MLGMMEVEGGLQVCCEIGHVQLGFRGQAVLLTLLLKLSEALV